MAFHAISPSKKNARRSSVAMTNGNLIQLSQFRFVFFLFLACHMMVFKTCVESVFFGYGETFTNIYAYTDEPKDVDETHHAFLSARLIYFIKICLDDNSKMLLGCIIYYYSWANIQNGRLSIKVFEYIRHSGSERIIFGLPRNEIQSINKRI